MAILRADHREAIYRTKETGLSLIELMLALASGILVLMAVGQIFILAQSAASERQLRLLVMHNIFDALQLIKKEIQRAGFQLEQTKSFILSGSDKVIAITPTSINYGYQSEGDASLFIQSSFVFNDQQLRICRRSPVAQPIKRECGTVNNPSFALLDDTRIKVTNFHVSALSLGESEKAYLYTITLSASLWDGRYPQTASIRIKQRNWQ